MKAVKRYALTFFILLAAALLALAAAAVMPQSLIYANLQKSIAQFEAEGSYPHILDATSEANKLDNCTDMMILNTSAYMDESDSFSRVLTNPFLRITGDGNAHFSSFKGAAIGIPPNENYVRYWMGFRALMRPLLVFFNYAEIRGLSALAFFSLFSAVLLSIRKRCGLAEAAAFAAAILFFKPVIISSELQYSCCFIIAFIAMLALPRVEKFGVNLPPTLLFFIVGALTQYFDFYTTPLVTFGFPLCFLMMMKDSKAAQKERFALGAKCLISWLGAYAAMWLAKLTLTTLFTDINAFSDGFSALAGRVGVVKDPNNFQHYSIATAFKSVFAVLLDKLNIIVFFAILLVWAVLFIRNRRRMDSVRGSVIYLAICALPMIWFAVSAQPSSIHAFFQYRTIAVAVFAMLIFLANTARGGVRRSHGGELEAKG